jgi:hypothetical protein
VDNYSHPDALSVYLTNHVSVCHHSRTWILDGKGLRVPNRYPSIHRRPRYQNVSSPPAKSGPKTRYSPILLARRGNLLHLAHALVIRGQVVIGATADLVLAWSGITISIQLSTSHRLRTSSITRVTHLPQKICCPP